MLAATCRCISHGDKKPEEVFFPWQIQIKLANMLKGTAF
jgi:hypothetical protein